MFLHINLLSVLTVALLAVAVGSIWYSPLLFGKTWMQSLGKSDVDIDVSTQEMIIITIRAVLIYILFFGVLAWVHAQLLVSYSLGTLGAVMLSIMTAHLALISLWERRPFSYLLVHTGYSALVLFGGLSVIMYWPW